MDGLVCVVDQSKLVPVVDSVEEPQLFTTVTTGAEGIVTGAAVPDPFAEVHPATVCVTVYVPAVPTVIEEPVCVVDQRRFEPVAVKVEVPQLLTTVTIGADGAPGLLSDPLNELEAQPLL